MKQKKSISYIFFFLMSSHLYSQDMESYIQSKWKLSKTQIEYLHKGKVLAQSQVKSKEKTQKFDLKAMAYHSVRCSKALRKLSLLESYNDYIGFIKSSKYNDKNKLFTLTADHTLLPTPMIIHIIVDRPTKMGKYPFTFPTGIFRGLKGYFEITEFNKRCLLYAQSHYNGKASRFPDIVIEMFSETLSKLGGELLMRKSK